MAREELAKRLPREAEIVTGDLAQISFPTARGQLADRPQTKLLRRSWIGQASEA